MRQRIFGSYLELLINIKFVATAPAHQNVNTASLEQIPVFIIQVLLFEAAALK